MVERKGSGMNVEEEETERARQQERTETWQEQTNSEEQLAMKVSAVSIVVNAILSVGKLLAGIVAHSGAMISDAVHSASDVFSTIVVMVGVHMAAKKSDEDHPYGHERMECVAAIVLAVVLAITGVGIGVGGVRTIAGGHYSVLAVPELQR